MGQALKLSKSQFILGQQCKKALWLYKHRKDFNEAAKKQSNARFDTGHEVGALAHSYFPGGVEVQADYWEARKAEAETKALAAANHPAIFEAVAIHPTDGSHAWLDVLRRVPGTTDEWDMIEVKSTGKVKPYHLEDIAFQYHVFAAAGYKIRSCSIMHVNSQYVRQGAIDPQGFFVLEDVTAEVMKRQAATAANIGKLNPVIYWRKEPTVPVGAHCTSPLPCKFKAHCWKSVPLYSVFNACGTQQAEQFVKDTGLYDVAQIPDALIATPEKKIEVTAHRTGQAYVDKDALKQFNAKLTYPLYVLDYESVMATIPLFDGVKPFQKIPYQFSVGVMYDPRGPLLPTTYIHQAKGDPRQAFITALLKACGDHGAVVVYGKTIDRSEIADIARAFPQYKAEIEALGRRIVDAQELVKNRRLYHPAQNGVNGLQTVVSAFQGLPVPARDKDEISYADYLAAQRASRKQTVLSALRKRSFNAMLGVAELLLIAKAQAAAGPPPPAP